MQLYGSLVNYISIHRKRFGLSQSDLAVLIALENRGSVSRYELGERLPDLKAALDLEIVLGHPIRGLFAGVAEKEKEHVAARARALIECMGDPLTRESQLKLELLSKLAHPHDDIHFVPTWEESV